MSLPGLTRSWINWTTAPGIPRLASPDLRIFVAVDDSPLPASVSAPEFAAAVGASPPPVVSGRLGWERGADNDRARGELDWRSRFPRFAPG